MTEVLTCPIGRPVALITRQRCAWSAGFLGRFRARTVAFHPAHAGNRSDRGPR